MDEYESVMIEESGSLNCVLLNLQDIQDLQLQLKTSEEQVTSYEQQLCEVTKQKLKLKNQNETLQAKVQGLGMFKIQSYIYFVSY